MFYKKEYHFEEELNLDEKQNLEEKANIEVPPSTKGQKKEDNSELKNSCIYQNIDLSLKKKIEDYIDGKVNDNSKKELRGVPANVGKFSKKNTLQKICVNSNKLKKCESQIKMKFPTKSDQVKFNTPNGNSSKIQDQKTKFFNDPVVQNYQKKLYKKSTFSVPNTDYLKNNNNLNTEEYI